MYSLAEENYLKALFHLSTTQEAVSLNELARVLGIKMPTATSMMKKMAAKKLVIYESYRPVRLTPLGRKEASLIIRKHRLTEMFLVEKMGFGWDEVHEIAEQLEHLNAPRFFEQMDRMLGHPATDPHGSPIPDAQGRMSSPEVSPLSGFPKGARVRLAGLAHTSNEFLQFLNSRELSLGLAIRVLHVEAFDGSMSVSYKGHPEVTLSREVCERLLVEA